MMRARSEVFRLQRRRATAKGKASHLGSNCFVFPALHVEHLSKPALGTPWTDTELNPGEINDLIFALSRGICNYGQALKAARVP